MRKHKDSTAHAKERWGLLQTIHELIEPFMIVLGLLWLALTLVDILHGVSNFLRLLTVCIWVVFILDFMLELAIAPHRKQYLKGNILTAASLVLPALRSVRLIRAARLMRVPAAVRAGVFVRLMAAINRGMASAADFCKRRGFGYVVTVTTIVLFAGAAGMLYFENSSALAASGNDGGMAGLNDYGEAVWWTAMLLTTIGTDYWPKTAAGRLLCWLLSLYAFTFFGYITATIASFFIDREK